jgi:hypothetical protein
MSLANLEKNGKGVFLLSKACKERKEYKARKPRVLAKDPI